LNKKLTAFALVAVMAVGTVGGLSYFVKSNVSADTVSTTPPAVTEKSDGAATDSASGSKTSRANKSEQQLDIATTKTTVSAEQAKQTALASVQGSTFSSIELENEHGTIVFEVVINNGSTTQEITVDATTGAIIQNTRGDRGAKRTGAKATEEQLDIATTKTTVSADQAQQTALASVPGSTFSSIELENEHVTVVFEVVIQNGSTTQEIKVDATTGAIIQQGRGDHRSKGAATDSTTSSQA
jgi:uncharacterized membrane protein YkoI